MQSTIIAGDSINYAAAVTDYTPTDGWSLRYRLTPRAAGGSAIDITATDDGDDWLVQVGSAVTAGWTAGDYTWASWVQRTGERYSIGQGQCVIKADPSTLAAGTDTRSQAQIALDAAKAALAAWTPTQRSYTINGRQMEFSSAADIVRIISYWKTQVTREAKATAMAQGQADPRKVYVRMGRA